MKRLVTWLEDGETVGGKSNQVKQMGGGVPVRQSWGTFCRTDEMMSASRTVHCDSHNGSRRPLKKAEGLYRARLRARYRWKLSLLLSLMSRWERKIRERGGARVRVGWPHPPCFWARWSLPWRFVAWASARAMHARCTKVVCAGRRPLE